MFATVIDFCIPFSNRLIFFTSEDYYVENKEVLGADEGLVICYSGFFSYGTLAFLPN